MSPQIRSFESATLAVAAVLWTTILLAQDPQSTETPAESPARATNGDDKPALTLADVEAALAAMEANTGIEDATKDYLRPMYREAIDALKEAASYAQKAAEYKEAMETAAGRTEDLLDQLKALPSVEAAARVPSSSAKNLSTEELRKEVESQRTVLGKLKTELSNVKSELARIEVRPVEISTRVPVARRELTEVRRQLELPELAEESQSPGRVAERILLRARESKLLSELAMLEQEELSQSVREDLLQAQRDVLARQVENAAATLQALEAKLHPRLRNEARQIGSIAQEAQEELPERNEAAQTLAAEVQALAEELEIVIEKLTLASKAQDDVATQIERLKDEEQSIKEQLELGGGGTAMPQILFDVSRRVLNAPPYSAALASRLPNLDETRIARLRIEAKIRQQPDLEKQFADRRAEATERLLAARSQVLEKLQSQYKKLIDTLVAVRADVQEYWHAIGNFRSYISKQLFLMKSSAPVSSKTLADLPDGLRWTFSSEHWPELGHAMNYVANRMPVRCGSALLILLLLLLMRSRISEALEHTGTSIRRISSDRYRHTGEALLWTVLLAMPIPLLLGCGAWAVAQAPQPSAWMQGIAAGLRSAAMIALVVEFLIALCRPGGLGDVHFGWPVELLRRFQTALRSFAVVVIPALLVTSITFYGNEAHYLDSLGRISFMVAFGWTAFVLWRLFRFSDGVSAAHIREHPEPLIVRWRYLWLALLVGCPLALVVLAGLGYVITAVEVSRGLLRSLALVVAGTLFYWLAVRWFSIKKRKLALAEAMERRRARREAAAGRQQLDEYGEVVPADAEEEEVLDLDDISAQTRHVLRVLFSLGVAFLIVLLWSKTVPVISTFQNTTIPLTGGLTLLQLTQAVLIAIVTYIAAQNLPGLLELAVLRTTSIKAGTRHAIATLCQYAVTAIGIALLLNVLRVDWAKFGWIVAALSVGLGFGLQEVVANFVCGLILLFERPIRVGDIVTVDGMNGIVTRIRARATTITNWDRQEFVVPNKNLITNTILNWTLSGSINRIIVPIGVAYGSDTAKALQIMLQAAAAHPNVLDDPPPLATFEEFSDSALTLRLRAYLPDIDNRLTTISELHSEINQRFAAAGIEIAFPQQDVHLRSGWNELAALVSPTAQVQRSARRVSGSE